MSEDNKEFEEQIRQSVDEAYDNEMESVNEQLDKEIIFALVGDVNVGKSSTINQLMNEKVALVSAKPGATTSIDKYKAENKNKIIFADTPGLHDIVKDNSEEAIRFFKQADVNLFLLNAAGTVFSDKEEQVFISSKS
jgi:GTP-binding protein Era